jgi:hypothetical protein
VSAPTQILIETKFKVGLTPNECLCARADLPSPLASLVAVSGYHPGLVYELDVANQSCMRRWVPTTTRRIRAD